MIRGRVVDLDALQPQIPLRVLGLNDAAETFDAVLDTGFTDDVSLPPDVVERLNLPFLRHAVYLIAGEREVKIPIHAAFVALDGESFEIDVLAQTALRSSGCGSSPASVSPSRLRRAGRLRSNA